MSRKTKTPTRDGFTPYLLNLSLKQYIKRPTTVTTVNTYTLQLILARVTLVKMVALAQSKVMEITHVPATVDLLGKDANTNRVNTIINNSCGYTTYFLIFLHTIATTETTATAAATSTTTATAATTTTTATATATATKATGTGTA